MTHVLIVEDSPTQAVQIQIMLEEADYDYKVDLAENGAVAAQRLGESPPDLILTDLHMPEMNGLELVEKVRADHPEIPVVVMTADGSEDIAARALKAGASSYIPKRYLERDLLPTLAEITEMLSTDRNQARVLNAVVESETTFEFGNDHHFASALISHLEADLNRLHYGDATGVFRIVLALKEAIVNAIDHGNLELDSQLRDESNDTYQSLGGERAGMEPFCNRRVRLTSKISATQVVYVIRDEGPGFDPSIIPDPTDPDNLIRAHGRGLMLIQSFMDEVSHNESGNEITLIKYRKQRDDSTSS